MKLFEIANEYQLLLDQLFDKETGEVDEKVVAKMDLVSDNMKNKSIAWASFIKNLDAEAKAIKEAKKAMEEREKRLNKQATSLSSYLQLNMERFGITEISCPYFMIKLKKCPLSVDILDESSIPDEYKNRKEIVNIDKIKIKEEILAGVVIPGAALRQNLRLEIK